MAQSLETGLRQQDPLGFVSHEIRRKIGYDFPDQIHANLWGKGLLLPGNYYGAGYDEPERIEFSERPKHENSDAHYIFEGFLGKGEVKDWVGIYVLLPNERTSEHGHPPGLTEEYMILRGEMTLFEDGKARVEDGVDSFVIYPGQRHHSRTEDDQFALVMVRMIGASQHDQLHLDSMRPEVLPEDPSPRGDAVRSLLGYYNKIYGTADTESRLSWIKTMSYRDILKSIQVAQQNTLDFIQNPKYNWIAS